MAGLHGGRRHTGLYFAHQIQDVASASEREREARAALAVRVDDPAIVTILLRAQLALDADVLAANGPEALYQGRYRVELSVLQTWDEAVAYARGIETPRKVRPAFLRLTYAPVMNVFPCTGSRVVLPDLGYPWRRWQE